MRKDFISSPLFFDDTRPCKQMTEADQKKVEELEERAHKAFALERSASHHSYDRLKNRPCLVRYQDVEFRTEATGRIVKVYEGGRLSEIQVEIYGPQGTLDLVPVASVELLPETVEQIVMTGRGL